MKKVTVKVPENQVHAIKVIAKTMREDFRLKNAEFERAPGWDTKIISKISKEKFGSFENMFVEMGWPERGSDMMRKVQKHVVNRFGSVEAFYEAYSE